MPPRPSSWWFGEAWAERVVGSGSRSSGSHWRGASGCRRCRHGYSRGESSCVHRVPAAAAAAVVVVEVLIFVIRVLAARDCFNEQSQGYQREDWRRGRRQPKLIGKKINVRRDIIRTFTRDKDPNQREGAVSLASQACC